MTEFQKEFDKLVKELEEYPALSDISKTKIMYHLYQIIKIFETETKDDSGTN